MIVKLKNLGDYIIVKNEKVWIRIKVESTLK